MTAYILTLAILTVWHVFLWIVLLRMHAKGTLGSSQLPGWGTAVFGLLVLYFIATMTWIGIWLGVWVGGKVGGWIGGVCFFLFFFRDYNPSLSDLRWRD